jgi:hypothetical protein
MTEVREVTRSPATRERRGQDVLGDAVASMRTGNVVAATWMTIHATMA